ncbi:unnamed protein product [Rhizoctonia solani]|uniref:Uncharacterized protein n=1 Tax=Rhizoctonia solani TaxID=456999 RepID=A0A8H3E589_9AGAM|nr:unnamed protein product [Rhizoctonia solani]
MGEWNKDWGWRYRMCGLRRLRPTCLLVLPNGIYAISCECVGGEYLVVNIPQSNIKPGEPVRLGPLTLPVRMSTHIRVENVDGDRYRLTPAEMAHIPGGLGIAARNDAMPHTVMLLPTEAGEDDITEWVIEQSGSGTYFISPPPEAGCDHLRWTATGEDKPVSSKFYPSTSDFIVYPSYNMFRSNYKYFGTT